MASYYNKYIKYKTKYLNLRQTGGELSPIIQGKLNEVIRNNNNILNLRLLGISDDDVTELADWLRDNTIIQELDLGYNKIGDAGARALAEMLEHNTIIQELDLSVNEIGDAGAIALAYNTTLRELILYENPINDVGRQALVERERQMAQPMVKSAAKR
jgi:Leucine-rich repeat (LRR) protein